MIQRYAFDGAYYEVPYEEGAYVMYADHVAAMAAAQTRIAELESHQSIIADADLKLEIEGYANALHHANKRIAELEAQVKSLEFENALKANGRIVADFDRQWEECERIHRDPDDRPEDDRRVLCLVRRTLGQTRDAVGQCDDGIFRDHDGRFLNVIAWQELPRWEGL